MKKWLKNGILPGSMYKKNHTEARNNECQNTIWLPKA